MINPEPLAGVAIYPTPGALKFSSTTTEIFAAYIAAQADAENVTTDSKADVKTRGGSNYSYSYASLAAILQQMRPVLQRCGLGILQGTDTTVPGQVTVDTRLIHTSGEWVENSVSLHVDPHADAQTVGSAMSYARRYGLTALLAIATAEDDDDGARAAQSRPRRQNTAPSEPAPVDPFDAPDRNPELVDRDEYNEIIEIAHGLTDTERRALTAWREAQGIVIKPSTLTKADAAKVLEYIAAQIGLGDDTDDGSAEQNSGPDEPVGPVDLESLPENYT